jgi:hypothetical protein
MKNCNKCNEVKSYEFFNKHPYCKDGYLTMCKSCASKIKKEYDLKNKDKHKEYRINNKERIKEYRINNEEYFKEYRKNYRINNKEYFKKYYQDNKEKLQKNKNEYIKNKLQNDSLFRFGFNTRNLIKRSFKRNNNKFIKTTKSEKILGCKIEEFRNYIEIKFDKKMTFENYGEWHLDHIIPISSATTEEEIIRLNHYTNFQPMWAKENISKGNKIIEKQLTLL